jgi:hypothetical protein
MPEKTRKVVKSSRKQWPTTSESTTVSPQTTIPTCALQKSEVVALLKFYYNSGFISYEYGDEIRELKKRLEQWSRENGIAESDWASDYSR